MDTALRAAYQSYSEGGIPVGSALVEIEGQEIKLLGGARGETVRRSLLGVQRFLGSVPHGWIRRECGSLRTRDTRHGNILVILVGHRPLARRTCLSSRDQHAWYVMRAIRTS